MRGEEGKFFFIVGSIVLSPPGHAVSVTTFSRILMQETAFCRLSP